MKSAILVAMVVVCGSFATAQDTRHVSEPQIPPVCRSLDAQLKSVNGDVAEADESKLDTARIQQAIDACRPGTAVELRSAGGNDAFLSAPIELKTGITLLVAANTTLFASRNPRDYDLTTNSCGKVDNKGRGCRPLIHIDKAKNAAIMGDGIIDGRGGAKLLGQDVSWWDLAQQAKVENEYQNCFRMVVADQADGFILYRITLRNSPNFHVIVSRTNGFTAWGVKINTPKAGRNTDGIDPSSSSNVSILYSYINAGDDNVAIKAGSNGPATNITVAHDHFYAGHGMSIGSETKGGVSGVEVRDLTIDGADNGIRIKSNRTRGGLVHDIAYHDVCMRNVKNPIVMETTYEHKTEGDSIPVFQGILLQNIRVLGGGRIALDGADSEHPLQMHFDGVVLSDVLPRDIHASHAKFVVGPGEVNFAPKGDDVQVTTEAGSRKVPACDGRFVPMAGPGAPYVSNTSASVSSSARLTVATDDTGDFHSVQQAVDALPPTGGTIAIHPGTYREVVRVNKPHVRFEGDAADPSKVEIVFNKSAGTAGGTSKTATVEIDGDDFFATGITFANDFSKMNALPAEGGQAVALMVKGDRAVFRKVRMLGAQDTLYARSKSCASEQGPCEISRQYYSDCYVEGHVDFIFGDAKAVFENCEIHGIAHDAVMLTAQSRRYQGEDSGYVFDHCRITADPGAKHIFLGRPWRPYATVVYLNSDMEAPIEPAGWSEWAPGKTNSLETATYAEFQSTGPGANAAARDPHSHQLSAQQAAQYSPRNFLAGSDHWDPLAVE